MTLEKELHKQLDLIVPVFNPGKQWYQILLKRFNEFRSELPELKIKLILVNDGSTNIDQHHLKQIVSNSGNIHTLSYPVNRGKGYAIRQGVRESTGDWIMYSDVDLPYTIDSMVNMIKTLRSGAELVVGVRDTAYFQSIPGQRKRISKLLQWMIKVLLRLPVSDTQAGLKAFSRELKADFLETQIDRYLFDLEFLKITNKNKRVIVQLPIQLKKDAEIPRLKTKILRTEIFNFIRILFK